MNLESLISYVLALVVPLWLVGECLVATWRSPRAPRSRPLARRVHSPGTSRARSIVLAGRLAGSRRPA
jgi:hypothetical protein